MTTTRTLIQRLAPDSVVTDLDRPTITTGNLGEPGPAVPKKPGSEWKPPAVVEVEVPPMTVEISPPKKKAT